MSDKKYIPAKELVVYQLARKLSIMAWEIFSNLSWEDKKNMGDQFISSTDSVGANVELLFEREKIDQKQLDAFLSVANELRLKLNNFISTTYNQYRKSKDGTK